MDKFSASIKAIMEDTTQKKNVISMSVPLFIRCLEWAHEDAKDDVEIHKFVENMLNSDESIKDTDDYEEFLPKKD